MKKVYTKPEIMFESFSLSQAIAGDCGTPTYTPNSGTCAYTVDTKYGSWNVFTSTVANCTTKDYDLDGSDDGIYNGICYDVPVESTALFNS